MNNSNTYYDESFDVLYEKYGERMFRRKQKEYKVQDLRATACYMGESDNIYNALTDADFEDILDMYEKYEDCNIPDNTTREFVIQQYVSSKNK